MEDYLAHVHKNTAGEIEDVQTVSEHCYNAAKYSALALAPVALSESAYLAGLVHDAGKCTLSFQNYLLHQAGARGSVNHTFTGVRLLLSRYHNETLGPFADVVCELLVLAAGGHHGLFDCIKKGGGFQHRMDKEGIDYGEALEGFLRSCADWEELDWRFQKSCEELAPVLEKILSMTGEDNPYVNDETAFYCGLLARLLLSAVIEGDRRDTAEFMNNAKFPEQRDGAALEQLWGKCLDHVEKKLDEFPQSSKIDRARREISDQCSQATELPAGVVRLNVPTGGGKTLSSLRYALAYARKYKRQRIIFASPLLSILDQNADVIREYVQDDSLILEHHSNLVHTKEDLQELDEQELLMETWDSPIIITTLVQLLNTLFSGKTSAIRRFHSLCGSVIVIDEVQTVPSKLLTLFSLAVNFLAEICGATVVLCSATQPCMEKLEHPIHMPIPNLIPYSPALWAVFRRTDIQKIEDMSLEEIAQFALEHLETSLLIVCNKKAQAEQLSRLLKDGDFDLFHLSAAMCTAHRRDTLDKLRASLMRTDRKTVCVSTQVIEAGVDISFACVIRLAAGMDSVVQAAGRCNRSGEAGPGILAPVWLVQCKNESLAKLPDIQRGKDATQELLGEFQLHPEQYRRALDSDEAIGCYYRALYRKTPEYHHDYVYKDYPSLFSLLSLNESCEEDPPYSFRQAFRLAGELFQVFEENTTDVIVPYGEGARLVTDLCGGEAERDPAYLRELLEEAKPYTVSLYQYQIARLEAEHGLIPLQGGAIGLNGHYSAETGFFMDDTNLDFLGV